MSVLRDLQKRVVQNILLLILSSILFVSIAYASSVTTVTTTNSNVGSPAASPLAQTLQQINTPNQTPSYQPPLAPPATAGPTNTSATGSKRLWNLQDADIRAVVDAVSRETGRNFILDPRVQGKITIVSSRPIDSDEVYEVFLSALQVLGYSAVPSGDITKIVPSTSARSMSAPIATSHTPGFGDESVVRVVKLRNVSASQLVPILRPLLPESGALSAYTPTNSIVIAGEANNVNRLTEIAQNLDSQGDNQIKIVPLRHAAADRVLIALNQLLSAETSLGRITTVSLSADKQSNSILVSGSREDQVRYEQIINKLDASSDTASGSTRVFYLNYLKAKTFAPILAKIAHSQYLTDTPTATKLAANAVAAGTAGGGDTDAGAALEDGAINSQVSIQAEPSNNAVIISAPPNIMDSLARVIAELDVQPQQVLVEAIIAQVDESQMKKLGITWGSINNSDNNSSDSSTDTSTGGGILQPGFNLGVGFIQSGDLQVILTALSGTNTTDILSTPSVVVLDNQKATIEVGKTISVENRVYATSDTGASSATQDLVPFTTLDRQNVALKLIVTPQISPNQTIRLNINQKNDTLQNPDNPGTTPIVNTSNIQTSVIVKSGDILVLGGLISHEFNHSATRVPILASIPGIGKLFQFNDKNLAKKNLLIFLRPIIINHGAVARDQTMARYNYIRQQELIKQEGGSIVPDFSNTPVLPPLRRPSAGLPSPFYQEPYQKSYQSH